MLYGEILVVYCENHTKHTNTLWGQNAEILMFKHVSLWQPQQSHRQSRVDTYRKTLLQQTGNDIGFRASWRIDTIAINLRQYKLYIYAQNSKLKNSSVSVCYTPWNLRQSLWNKRNGSVGLAGHVARKGQITNECKLLVLNRNWRDQLGDRAMNTRKILKLVFVYKDVDSI
jgi:hypothetical protein